jgi:beta-glucosidase
MWMLILTYAEWQAGYTDRFGVTFIEFESKDKTRYPKRSAKVLKEMFQKLISEK